MFKLLLVLGAGYAAFRLAYNSEDGIHYGKVGARSLRTGLSLFFAALAAGLTYSVVALR